MIIRVPERLLDGKVNQRGAVIGAFDGQHVCFGAVERSPVDARNSVITI
jgi:hypothetical protein